MPTIVLLGTLDTKGAEYDFVRRRLVEQGCDVIMVDAGVMGQDRVPVDIGPDEVARAADADRGVLAANGDRGTAVATMARGAIRIITRLHVTGRLDAVLALGASSMERLPTEAAITATVRGFKALRPTDAGPASTGTGRP